MPDDAAGREAAIEVLRAGGIVALPTDTVYGIAVALDTPGGIERLFHVKRRPPDKGIVLLLDDGRAGGARSASMGPAATALGGGLLARRPDRRRRRSGRTSRFPAALTGGAPTIGLRVPDHDAPRALARGVGPLPTTSANVSGLPEARDAAEILDQLGDAIDLILDGGVAHGGPASTVVDCTGDVPSILRVGAITVERGRDPGRTGSAAVTIGSPAVAGDRSALDAMPQHRASTLAMAVDVAPTRSRRRRRTDGRSRRGPLLEATASSTRRCAVRRVARRRGACRPGLSATSDIDRPSTRARPARSTYSSTRLTTGQTWFGHDPDDLADGRPRRPGRQLHDAVVVVDPLDDRVRVAEDRAVAGEERRHVLGQDLRPGIDDEAAARPVADDGRGDQQRRVVERLAGQDRLLPVAEDVGPGPLLGDRARARTARPSASSRR